MAAFTQDQLMHLISIAFGQGAGPDKVIAASAADALRNRYFDWLIAVKPGNSQSPLDVWGQSGGDFLGKIRSIGQLAASLADGSAVEDTQVLSAASTIEQSSDCPWCP
jgi:hypothetical protein